MEPSKTTNLTANQLVTKEDLQEFQKTLLNQLQEIVNQNKEPKKWLRVVEVKELLKISASTLQTLRLNGTLSYTKLSGMYYYNYEDIEKLINNNFKEVEKQPKVFKIKRCKN